MLGMAEDDRDDTCDDTTEDFAASDDDDDDNQQVRLAFTILSISFIKHYKAYIYFYIFKMKICRVLFLYSFLPCHFSGFDFKAF